MKYELVSACMGVVKDRPKSLQYNQTFILLLMTQTMPETLLSHLYVS